MAVVQLPIHLGQEERLVAGSRHDASEAREEVDAVSLLRGRNASRLERGELRRRERTEHRRRIGRRRNAGKIACLLVVAEEEEHLVLLDRPADRPAELLTAILRLHLDCGAHAIHEHVLRLERVGRPPLVVAKEVEARSVELVRPALGHSVHDSAGGAAVLGRVVRRRHLELSDGVGADRIRETRAATFLREEGLRVVPTVDGVVVQEAGDPAEADEAEGAVRCGARRHQRKRRPATRVRRQVGDRRLVDVGGEVRLLGVDDGRFRRDLHGLDLTGEPEPDVERRRTTDFHDDVVTLVRREAAERHFDGVHAGRQVDDQEAPVDIRGGVRCRVGGDVADGHGRAGDAGLGLVSDKSTDRARRRGLRQQTRTSSTHER